MYMTIQQILREKNLSRYQLSKKSGVPWATLADICSGKTTLSRCSAGTLMKLSSTLDIPMEQLITLTVEKPQMHGGKPTDRTYWKRICLPVWIKRFVSTFRAKRTRCLIWTVCGENCIVRLTPISGAMPSRRSRLIIFAQNIYFENVPELLPIQREFYLTMLTERKEKILDYSLELLMEQEQHTSPVLEM